MTTEITVPAGTGTAQLKCMILPSSPEIVSQQEKPLVLVCPGGGYEFCSDREAEPIAAFFLAAGYHTAILRYSVMTARYPDAALELAWSVQYLRRHAQQWHIRPDQIYVTGFSAGGHLAATLGTTWHWPVFEENLEHDVSWKPDGQILAYPVITLGEYTHEGSRDHLLGADASPKMIEQLSLEKQVTSKTVPTFLWATVTDDLVPVENSMMYAAALRRCGVPFELHLYEQGCHGLATCKEITGIAAPDVEGWMDLAARFIKRHS